MGRLWRKGGLRLAPIIGLLLVFGATAPLSTAVTESLAVFVFPPSPDQVYKVGDTVTVSIRVFNFGKGADADNLTVQLNRYSFEARWVSPIRTGLGNYNATFQIQSSDLNAFSYYGGYSLLEAYVVARIGLISAEQAAVIRAGTLLTATVTASPMVASPGQSVDVVVEVRTDGVLTDADAVYVNATVTSFPYSSTSIPIAVTHSATGTYEASYAVPSSIDGAGTIVLTAQALVRGNYTYASAYIFVSLPVRLDVWTHQVSTTDTSALVEVYAANQTAWPVADANVSMRYQALGYPYPSIPVERFGTTDRRGSATFNLTFDAHTYVTFWGNVTKGTDRAFYTGSVFPNYTPPAMIFEIRREAGFPFYEVGAVTLLNYTVRYSGFPIAGQTVYYYAATSSEVVANGSSLTDSVGRLQISFAMPAAPVRIDFATFIGSSWLSASDYVGGTRPLSVQHGELRIGAVTHVTVSVPPAPGPWAGIVLFVPYNFSAPYPYLPPTWLPGGSYGGVGSLIFPAGPTFSYDLRIPRFLPKDSDYLLAVEALSLNYSDLGNLIPYAYFEKVHITNAPPTLVADLSGSTLGPGEVLTVNLSRSADVDGLIDAYGVEWGDGSATGWVQTESVRHAYATSGDYTVTVQVRDDTGAIASMERTVHVETGILGLRVADFFALTGIVVAGVATSVALLIWRTRKRPRAPTAHLPNAPRPESPAMPPPPGHQGDSPLSPPPPP